MANLQFQENNNYFYERYDINIDFFQKAMLGIQSLKSPQKVLKEKEKKKSL